MGWKVVLTAAGIACATAFTANAGVVLTDAFSDGSTSILNWSGDSVFASPSTFTGGIGTQSTDYVAASNPYGITCYTGALGCVDLDGSQPAGTANPAGFLQSNAALAAGSYTLTFELSGNQRGAPAAVTVVDVGGIQVWTSGSVASNSGWMAESVTFTTAGGNLDFVDTGLNNDQGNLLDKVSLFSAVPEPASWALMIVGMAGLGGILRRRNRAVAI
ncbi:MAG TPA: PEPxxWA-CTERM sorting domain-containing protein [Caulobacteraceae bacterium]